MANEKRLIDADELIRIVRSQAEKDPVSYPIVSATLNAVANLADGLTIVDAVEVIRCQNCIHAEPLDRNCELSTTYYLHCKLWRGEETKNVWHKYKKYYKDYSLVERDGYCDAGAKMDGGNEDGNRR